MVAPPELSVVIFYYNERRRRDMAQFAKAIASKGGPSYCVNDGSTKQIAAPLELPITSAQCSIPSGEERLSGGAF
jgi:hypothetical protein